MKVSKIVFKSTGKAGLKIEFGYNPTLISLVKTLSGRKFHAEPYEKFWTCPMTLDNISKLKEWGFFITSEILDYMESLITKIEDVVDVHIPPTKFPLFEYQKKGVSFIEAKNGRVLIADEMGLGKTCQALTWVNIHPEKKPIVIVVPASLKLNWERECKIWIDNPKTQILSGKKPYPLTGEIIIINYDIVEAWLDTLISIKPQILITDECFPAGTKIKTPSGDKNIEDIKPGDTVFNAAGIGTVERIGNQIKTDIVYLHLSNGQVIEVTAGHPFFTTDGWITAQNTEGKYLLTFSDVFNLMTKDNNTKTKGIINEKNKKKMSSMSRIVSNERVEPTFLQSRMRCKTPQQQKGIFSHLSMVWGKIQRRYQNPQILRDILLSEMENDITTSAESMHIIRTKPKNKHSFEKSTQEESRISKKYIQKDEAKQPIIQTRSDEKNQGILGRIWTSIIQTATKRREWAAIPTSTKNAMGSTRTRMENGISYQNKEENKFWVSAMLQGGYSITRKKSMDRNRRMGTPITKFNRNRQEKRATSEHIRVDRVTFSKPGDNGKLENRTVYNLQVSGHPSYYAEGVLVHNCHKWKNPKANRTKAIKKLSKKIPHIIALSGSPIENRPVEIYNVVNVLAPEIAGSYRGFTIRYCAGHQGYWGWDASGSSNIPELHEKLTGTIMIRRKKEDVLKDLPEKIRSIVPMELKSRRNYDLAERDFIEFIKAEKGLMAAEKARRAEALARISALKQIAAQEKLEGAIDWIKDHLDTNGKLVVFGVHKNIINQVMEALSDYRPVKVDGSTPNDIRQKNVDTFQNDDSCRVFIGNIQAAGVGLTLTAASSVCFLEFPWSPSEVLQAEDRAHRIGQNQCVNIYFLIAQGTIDEMLINLIDQKMKIIDGIIDGAKHSPDSSIFNSIINGIKNKN